MRFSFLPATAAFFAAYLLFDWVSYFEPLLGLNITPWNPDTALGLVFWLVYGRRAALPWFLALVAGDVLVRGTPGGLSGTLLTAAWLTCGYGLLGETLRRALNGLSIFNTRGSFYHWLAIVAAGTMLNAVGHISLLAWLGLVPWSEWLRAVWRFGFGDRTVARACASSLPASGLPFWGCCCSGCPMASTCWRRFPRRGWFRSPMSCPR